MLTFGENSYVTVSEAEELLIGNKFRESFMVLSTEEKEALLIAAAMRVDSLPFRGRKYDPRQAMEFPRNKMKSVPFRVKMAQVSEAVCVLDSEAENRRSMAEQGVTSVTLGKVSEGYGGTSGSWDKTGLKSRAAYYFLRPYTFGGTPIV